MLQSGLHTWTDQVANVHGRINARNTTAPALVLGSHYDTVKDAGRFDGALGILAGITAMKTSILQVCATCAVLSYTHPPVCGHHASSRKQRTAWHFSFSSIQLRACKAVQHLSNTQHESAVLPANRAQLNDMLLLFQLSLSRKSGTPLVLRAANVT